MVNVVFHKGRSVSTDLDEDTKVDHADHDDELNEQTNEVNPLIYQSFFGGWYSNYSRDEKTLRKKLTRSFGRVTNNKRRGKTNSDKMEKFFSDMAREKLIQFSSKQIKIFTRNFCNNIGSGGFGRVYKIETANGVQVAITLNSSPNGEINAGVSMLRTAYSRILINLFGFVFDTSINSLAYDFMKNGSLDRFLFDKNGTIDWEKLYHITVGTAKGLSYLHQYCNQLTIYYDIKPSNILFDSNFCRRVANSGLVELYDRNVNLAPELSSSFETICKYDVHLFGMKFTILVKRNGELYIEKLQLPEQAWDKFERGTLERGSEETNREHAKRILMIALWFVEHIPKDSPSSSTVETMLGEMEDTGPLYFPTLVSFDEDSQVSITTPTNSRKVTKSKDLSHAEIFTPVMERFKF